MCCQLHLAGSSRRAYAGHQGIFIKFCEEFDLDPLLVSEDELCLVVAHFALGHTVNSVPPYLSALQDLFTSAGAGPLPRGPKFLLFCRGLKRLLGTADEVVRARALSLDDVARICASLNQRDPADVGFGLQMIFAFFLALRTEDHTGGRLRWGDVFPQRDGSVEFVLPPGKSVRTFRHVAIADRSDALDPLAWLRRHASNLPQEARAFNRPVFVDFAPGRGGVRRFPPLTRSRFIARLKRAVKEVLGFSPALYAGYSLRRGGVTEMLSRNVPMPVVKAHVGWVPTSDAPNTYYDHAGHVQMRLPTRALGPAV